jgi:hypothetical protein
MKKSNLKNALLTVLSILYLSIHSGCSSIQELDKPFCVELNITKGFCTTPLSGKDQIIDDKNLLEGKSWWDMRPTMIMIPPSTYSAIKSFIIKQCKKHPDTCDREIPAWDRASKNIDSQMKSKSE